MRHFEELAEERIRRAIERGELDDLPGRGRPLALDADEGVPPELRMAYRVLKNAGYVPQEVSLRREIARVEDLLAAADEQGAGEDARYARAVRRLNLLRAQLAARRRGEPSLHLESTYCQKALRRLGGG